jgi:hypothetical protein
MQRDNIKKWIDVTDVLTDIVLAVAIGILMGSYKWGIASFVVSLIAEGAPRLFLKHFYLLQQSIVRKSIIIILFTCIGLLGMDNVYMGGAKVIESYGKGYEKLSACPEHIDDDSMNDFNKLTAKCREQSEHVKDGTQAAADNIRSYVNVFGAYWPSWWIALFVWAMVRLLIVGGALMFETKKVPRDD